MPPERVIRGQIVDPVKAQRAKELQRAMTREEAMLWSALRANRLGGLHFRRQQIVAGFILDFYCHAAGLAVEVDGGVHQLQDEYDAQRDAVLAAHGIRVMRIPNEEVRSDFATVLSRIAEACAGAITNTP